AAAHLGTARDLAHENAYELRRHQPRAEVDPREAPELFAQRYVRVLDALRVVLQEVPRVAEDRGEHFVLRAEVVVQEPVRDACFFRDVADASCMEPLAGEHTDRRVDELLLPVGAALSQSARSIIGPPCLRSPASRSPTSRASFPARSRAASCFVSAPAS